MAFFAIAGIIVSVVAAFALLWVGLSKLYGERVDNKWVWIPLIVIAVGILSNRYGCENDPRYALDHAVVATKYGQISYLSVNKIEIDHITYTIKNNVISQKFPVDLLEFKVGDIVRLDVLSTGLNNYLICVEKIAETP